MSALWSRKNTREAIEPSLYRFSSVSRPLSVWDRPVSPRILPPSKGGVASFFGHDKIRCHASNRVRAFGQLPPIMEGSRAGRGIILENDDAGNTEV